MATDLDKQRLGHGFVIEITTWIKSTAHLINW